VSTGGWGFLGNIRDSLRKAANAEGRNWPYLIAENSATQPWDISNPSYGVLDGQWGIDESYRVRDACYDLAHPGWDESQNLAKEMDNPAYWGRPYYQAVRFGESHDMVSALDSANQRIAARPPFGFGYQMAKAMGALTLLSNGTPMLFMGQEIGETDPFSFPDFNEVINPQNCELPAGGPTDQTCILAWFRQLMGLRNDASKGLRGSSNYQVVVTGNRTIAYTCGSNQSLFAVITFGTPNVQQDSSWLGLPRGSVYKEIFNSSWPVFQVESEQEHANGGYDAQITSGQLLNLPPVGAVVLERR
jgi:1,4-alpha-glucan branching enzyme